MHELLKNYSTFYLPDLCSFNFTKTLILSAPIIVIFRRVFYAYQPQIGEVLQVRITNLKQLTYDYRHYLFVAIY